MMKRRKKSKNKKTICRLIKKSSEKAIKNAPVENREEVIAMIEEQRDAALEHHGCQ